MIELDLGADARRVVDEVKSNIDAITTFPIETEKPIIRELTSRQQIVDIAVSGDLDPFTLKQVTERVRDELTAIPEITQVDLVSAPPYEISIEVSEDDLRRHGLTFDQVAQAVRRSSLDLPGRCERSGGRSCCGRSGRPAAGQSSRTSVLWTRAPGPLDASTSSPTSSKTDSARRTPPDQSTPVQETSLSRGRHPRPPEQILLLRGGRQGNRRSAGRRLLLP